MKKCGLLQTIILSSGILAFTTIIPTSNQAFAESLQKTINVSGEGKISVSPDIAYIDLGVQSQKNSAREAQEENAKSLEKVYAVLEANQISKEDIQTVEFTVNPIYTWDQNKQVFQGYQVRHMLQVKDRNLEDLGKLLDHITEAGANQVNNIQFDTEKREQYQIKAMDMAMDNAAEKANYLAGKIGQSIQSIISIHESGAGSVARYIPLQAGAKASADSAPTQISAGMITVTASVDVTYGF